MYCAAPSVLPPDTDLVPPTRMEFIWIPPGEFQMGSTTYSSNDLFEAELPVTHVRLTEGFWLGKYEVTQEEWEAVMGSNPSHFGDCPRCPVESVSWMDVQKFITRLNADAGTDLYRLPTEAGWEYAARGGTTGDAYGGNTDDIAWWSENSGDRTHSVGQKVPNGFGLHDMLGNVSEWASDRHRKYPGATVTDPRGEEPGEHGLRVARGGGWSGYTFHIRAPIRGIVPPGQGSWNYGFRLLRTR